MTYSTDVARSLSYLRRYLTLLACCGSLVGLADTEGVYAFVDEFGGVNLTNVPDDERYEVLIAPVVVKNVIGRDSPATSDRLQRYDDVIRQTASRYGIDEALLRAVIYAESGYDPNAISSRGAGGLMQLMPGTAKRFGVANVFDPAENVRGGAQYLAELLKMFDNDLHLALAAYNAGEGAVLKYGKRVPPYPETTEYVSKVVAFYQRYRVPM